MKRLNGALAGCLLLFALAGALAAGLFVARQPTQAGHNPPIATFAIDVNTAGNDYNGDPNSDGDASDNTLVVETGDFCIRLDSAGPTTIDVIGRDMREVLAYDIRLKYDPSLVTIRTANHTPFTDPSSIAVGFINLPVQREGARRDVAPANNINNAEGTAFLVATHIGPRTPFFSPDHRHPPGDAEPYAADDPEGVVLARLNVSLKSAADGKVVLFDLASSPPLANDYISFNPNTREEEVIPVPDENLIDGAIAVNADCPSSPPTRTSGPGPAGTAAPGATATAGGPTGEPGTAGTPGGTAAGTSPGSPIRAQDRGDDSDGSSWWLVPLIALGAVSVLAGAAGAVWWWRRRPG